MAESRRAGRTPPDGNFRGVTRVTNLNWQMWICKLCAVSGANSAYTSLSGALVAAGRKSESQRSFRTHLKSASNPTPNLGPSRNSLGQGPPRVIKYPKYGDSLTTDMLSPAVTISPTKKNQPP